MTAPNHIAGGIVITGFVCSIYDINILESWQNITFCVLGSLLPDIDHTKSLIGKICYPISRYLGRKYGHRTITHSLLFLVVISASFYLFLNNYFLIITTAIISHFILDMITVQGVPLLYPFYRNPCVIPANPDLRIRTGNIKQEGLAFFIFAILNMGMADLYAQGFWTTYNKQFTSINHIYRQQKQTANWLEIKYEIIDFGMPKKGTAYLLASTQKHLILSNKLRISDTVTTQIKVLEFKEMPKARETYKIQKTTTIDSFNLFYSRKFALHYSCQGININEKNTNVFLPFISKEDILNSEKYKDFQREKIAINRQINERKRAAKELKYIIDNPAKNPVKRERQSIKAITLKKHLTKKIDSIKYLETQEEFNSYKNSINKVQINLVLYKETPNFVSK